MTKAALLVLLSSLFSTTVSLAEVLQLTDSNFVEKTAGKNVFIKFFAPWCKECQLMAPDWEQLAAEWKDHDIALVAEVDCTDSDSATICDDFEVTAFPALYWGDPQSPEEYSGEMDHETLSNFAKKHIDKPICNVNHLEHCDKEQKEIIAQLEGKTKAELGAMESNVQELLMQLQDKLDEDLETLHQQYEEFVNKFNDKVDELRDKTHYKWVQQVLVKMEANENDDAAKSEL